MFLRDVIFGALLGKCGNITIILLITAGEKGNWVVQHVNTIVFLQDGVCDNIVSVRGVNRLW